MKYLLLVISVVILSLLGANLMHGNKSQVREEMLISFTEEVFSCPDDGMEYTLPVSMISPFDDRVIMDAESLVGYLRVCGRLHRSFSFSSSIFSKIMAWKTVLIKMDVLSHSFLQNYTSLPCQCWSIPSEHYVFGMRRILI